MSAGDAPRGSSGGTGGGEAAKRRAWAHRDPRASAHRPTPDDWSGHRAVQVMPALRRFQEGRWGYILAWLIGVPVPILVVIYLLRGCT